MHIYRLVFNRYTISNRHLKKGFIKYQFWASAGNELSTISIGVLSRLQQINISYISFFVNLCSACSDFTGDCARNGTCPAPVFFQRASISSRISLCGIHIIIITDSGIFIKINRTGISCNNFIIAKAITYGILSIRKLVYFSTPVSGAVIATLFCLFLRVVSFIEVEFLSS